MAKLTEVVLSCDVHDGKSEAAGTVTFTVEGQSFECELSDDYLAEFREAMRSGPRMPGRQGVDVRAAPAEEVVGGGRGARPLRYGSGLGPRIQGQQPWSRLGRTAAAYEAAH